MKNLLIEVNQEDLVVCDNPKCDYKVPLTEENKNELLYYVDLPCPKCGQNLCTKEDFIQSEKVMDVINWLNKYFSWLNYVFFWQKKTTTNVHVHNGINIKK
jgi:ssDNA-binding Zn-finger/Zn-ribbon topoisomerase 1